MNTGSEIGTIDLARVRTVEFPRAYEYGQKTYRAVGSDDPYDIYKLLSLDENIYAVYIESFRSGMFELGDLHVFIIHRQNDDRYYSHTKDPRHVSISTGVCTPLKLAFRSPQTNRDIYSVTLTLDVSGDGSSRCFISSSPRNAEAAFGLLFQAEGIVCRGVVLDAGVPDSLYQGYSSDSRSNFSLQTLANLRSNIRTETSVRQLMLALKNKEGMTGTSVLKPSGIKKVFDRVFPFYEELLAQDEVFLIAAFHTLVFESKRTINGVSAAKLFNEFFGSVRDADAFKLKLERVYGIFAAIQPERWESYPTYKFEKLFVGLPGYTDLRKQAIHSQSGRALAKLVQDIDSIRFDREQCPLLAELIDDGSIPVSTFFRKEGDEAYFLFNDNWELFEEFLKKHREAGIALAQLASQRTTYEKNFMSYLYFILYDLPEYLKKYTGKTWTCFPKIVESSSELDPGRTEPGQTTKHRSALTPIVDNEACTVVVPYACLKVPGVMTTYTYSLNYSLIHRGLSIDGNVSMNDIEEKLNGRDDYGLMYYTLTGSPVGRGYPTFLIIFERLDGDETRVHFHRTHPLRSKNGDTNPVNNWIRTCYNWMVGNVNLANVRVQQGDLVFVSVDSLPDGEFVPVDSYDSHVFSSPVLFTPCTKKDSQNILGYFRVSEDVELIHPEHRNRVIPAGMYELRQCRSWEANPKGVWSLRID